MCLSIWSLNNRYSAQEPDPVRKKAKHLWLADDEFDASGRLLLNGSADHYLTIEDAVTAGSILLDAPEPARL